MAFMDLFRRKKIAPPEVVEVRPYDIPRHIWNHQVVMINTDQTVDLSQPMFDIKPGMRENVKEYQPRFPFVIGNHGELRCVTFARCFFNVKANGTSSVFLEYKLTEGDATKVVLRITGNDPQTIQVTKDERTKNHLPLILVLPKAKRKTSSGD